MDWTGRKRHNFYVAARVSQKGTYQADTGRYNVTANLR